MVKIDLITGFLGAGKTTFLKKYAQYLMEQGENIGILENDFGAVNVDMMLLQDLMGDNCELEMVAGGCDYDCHKRRFKTKLISMGMCGYDRVLVEPSGIYDVDEFFDVLHEEPLDRWYQINNVIAIVDSKLEQTMTKQAEYLLASQIAQAGSIFFSKVDDSTQEERESTIHYLNHVLEQFQCSRRLQNEIIQKDWSQMEDGDFEQIRSCGYTLDHTSKLWFDENEAFTSLYFMNVHMPEDKLRETAKALLQDTSCGKVFRVKGFMQMEDGTWIELNATKSNIRITPIPQGQDVIIVIGEQLAQDAIESYWKDYLPPSDLN